MNSSEQAQLVGKFSGHSDGCVKKKTRSKSRKRGRLTQGNSDVSREAPNSLDIRGLNSDPIWRGSMFDDASSKTVWRVEGYVSSKAYPEVRKLACLLPPLLHLERLPLHCPERLPNLMPLPTDENVHLIFLSEMGSDVELDNLMNLLINETLAMKASADGVDLFLFTSHQLKDKFQRINGKYYLVGILCCKLGDQANMITQNDDFELKPSICHLPAICSKKDSSIELYQTNAQTQGQETGKDNLQSSEGAQNSRDCMAERVPPLRNSADADERSQTPPAFIVDVLQRTPLGESTDIDFKTMPEGGVGSNSPDRKSGYSVNASVLHVLTALDTPTDSDEIDSASNSNVQVGQYFVRPSLAPILRRILDKQGDIARDCQLKSRNLLTSALEDICMVAHALEAVHFTQLQQHHFKSMETVVSDGQELKLDVEWLFQRFLDLRAAVDAVREYKKLQNSRNEKSKETDASRKSIDLKKSEVDKLHCEICLLENELQELEKESRTLKKKAADIATDCRGFCYKPLMDGLL